MCFSSQPARAGVDGREVVLSERGVAGLQDGQRQWTLPDPMRIRDRAEDDTFYPDSELDPTIVGDHAYYAIFADLWQIDLREGRVLERWRFPAQIVDLASKNDRLAITLNFTSISERDDPSARANNTLTVEYRPGAAVPGRGPATVLSPFTTQAEANLTLRYEAFQDHSPEKPDFSDLNATAQREGLEVLNARLRQNPTNPFYHVYRAVLLENLGKRQAAARALKSAADLEEAPWSDDLMLAATLESGGNLLEIDVDEALVDRVLERGIRKLREAGIRPRFATSKALAAALADALQIKEAVEARRPDAVDRRAQMLHDVFPNIDMGYVVWDRLATWFRRLDRPELADKWQTRARGADDNLWYRTHYLASRAVDLTLLLIVALALFLAMYPRPRTPGGPTPCERRRSRTTVLSGRRRGIFRHRTGCCRVDASGPRDGRRVGAGESQGDDALRRGPVRLVPGRCLR
ncbi:MAG: hypothetical protein ABEN55_20090 [Bradymonadaceae bacterium]